MTNKITHRIIRFSISIIIVTMGYFMINWLVEKMIYPAPSISVGPPPANMEEVSIKVSGGIECQAWLFREPSENDSIPVVLFLHGNGENLETMKLSGILSDFQNLMVNFLALDYPGYGNSGGRPSEKLISEAVDSAFIWLTDEFTDHPKVICGWSLGAGAAFQTAAKYNAVLDGFIAISPWSSLPDVAAAHYPRWLVKLVLQESYNSLEAAEKIHCPALVIHGQSDNIIPLQQGDKVARHFPNPPEWLPVPNTGHNDIFSRTIVWEEIGGFLHDLW